MDDREALRMLSRAMPYLAGPLVGGMPLDAFDMRVTSITASYDVASDDMVILADASDGAITVSLPPAAGALQQVFYVKKTDSSSNAVTIDPYGSETVDGATTYTLGTQYKSVCICCDGSAWYTLSGTDVAVLTYTTSSTDSPTTTTSTSYVDLMSVELTVARNALILLGTTVMQKNNTTGSVVHIALTDGNNNVLAYRSFAHEASGGNYYIPLPLTWIVAVAAGTYTYKVRWYVNSGTGTATDRSLWAVALAR